MKRSRLLLLAHTVVAQSHACQGSLRQPARGWSGGPGICCFARLLEGTVSHHDAPAAAAVKQAQAGFATQPQLGLMASSLLDTLLEQDAEWAEEGCDLSIDRTHTAPTLLTPAAFVIAECSGGLGYGAAEGQHMPIREPMHGLSSDHKSASNSSSDCTLGLPICEGEEHGDKNSVEQTTGCHCSTLPQTPQKGSRSCAVSADDWTADDTWYSLSPNFIDSKLPAWKKWRLNRRRYGPPDQPLGKTFRQQLVALGRYQEVWGDCLVPRRWWEDWRLGEWVADVRHAHKERRLTPTQIRALDTSGFVMKLPAGVADWNYLFHELRRFRQEHGQEGPEFKWRDPLADFTNNFAKWYHQQPELFKQRLLLPDQVWKLKQIGWDMHEVTGDDIKPEDYVQAHNEVKSATLDHEFETMYAQLRAWRDAYGTTLVPKQLARAADVHGKQVHDNVVLGAWVHRVRRQGREGRLPPSQMAKLEQLLFVWKVDLQSASWHYLLHEARRYKEVHGHAMIPMDYNNPKEVGWVQAARWITRNAKLFSKGKLTDKRYQLIRDILGIKFVKKIGGPSRRGGGNKQLASDARPLGPWNLKASGEKARAAPAP